MSDQDGNIMHGKIIAVSPEGIKMDFNHPLAGMDLHFTGQVVDVREATADEISHGHAHGPGGHHH
jgi:FKBP-type peptidyl-prolyl cis-trans isomerase SlyD